MLLEALRALPGTAASFQRLPRFPQVAGTGLGAKNALSFLDLPIVLLSHGAEA